MLRIAFSTGTTPDKWFRRFRAAGHALAPVPSDDALGELLAGRVEIALTRLPDRRVGEEHHVVNLYGEEWGAAIPRDSPLASADRITGGDLEHIQADGADPRAARAGLEVVATGVGAVIGPLPMLKMLASRGVVLRSLADASASARASRIGLVWRRQDDCEEIQDFVGTAKGRSPYSSRHAKSHRGSRDSARAAAARDGSPRLGARRSRGGRGGGRSRGVRGGGRKRR